MAALRNLSARVNAWDGVFRLPVNDAAAEELRHEYYAVRNALGYDQSPENLRALSARFEALKRRATALLAPRARTLPRDWVAGLPSEFQSAVGASRMTDRRIAVSAGAAGVEDTSRRVNVAGLGSGVAFDRSGRRIVTDSVPVAAAPRSGPQARVEQPRRAPQRQPRKQRPPAPPRISEAPVMPPLSEADTVEFWKQVTGIRREGLVEAVVRHSREKGFQFLEMAFGILKQESNNGEDRRVSSAGARGPFQIMPATARLLSRGKGILLDGEIFNPRRQDHRDRLHNDVDFNANLAIAFLKHMVDRYRITRLTDRAAYRLALGYHDGEAAKEPGSAEGRDYVVKVPRHVAGIRARAHAHLRRLGLAPAAPGA